MEAARALKLLLCGLTVHLLVGVATAQGPPIPLAPFLATHPGAMMLPPAGPIYLPGKLIEVPASRGPPELAPPLNLRVIYPNELYGPASLHIDSSTPAGAPQLKSGHIGGEIKLDSSNSYIIEDKRFAEAAQSRCLGSTVLEDPRSLEPELIIIKTTHEFRMNATASPHLIIQAGFEPHKKTVIFVHGFTQSYPNTTWLRRSRALFEINQQVPRYNLFIMDWGRASHGPFSQAAAVVNVMGSFLANFIMKLTDLGADRMSIHIVGHSLGAHVAGFAGKRLKPRIGRITALDPAGPCFGKVFSNGPHDRLAADDAYEVAVYHYDDDFLGLPGQHGQFDVYVNGGSQQPGCTSNVNAMFQAMLTMIFRRQRVLSESHTRSTEVSTVSLARSGCQQVAYECLDWPTFQQGECGKCDQLNNQCFLMSFPFQYGHNDETPLRTSYPGKRLFISTGANETNFCLHHYQALVKFEPHPDMRNAAKRDKWRITLEVLDDLGNIVNVLLTNQMAPNVFSALILVEGRPPRFRAARLQVHKHDGTLVNVQKSLHKDVGDKLVSHRIFTVEINFMSNIDPNIRRALSSRLCPAVRMPFLPPSWHQPLGLAYNSIDKANVINDSSQETKSEWLEFDECLPRAR